MINRPSEEQLLEVIQSINSRRGLYEEAVRLRDERFQSHFDKLEPDLQQDVLTKREAFLSYRESKEGENSSLKRYFRKAARRFHPDSIKSEEKTPFFRLATEAYTQGELTKLQIVLLQDMAGDYSSLNRDDKEFLFGEFVQLQKTADNIWYEAGETVVAAGQLELMSTQMFRLETTDAIKYMANEIKRRGMNLEQQHGRNMLEKK